MLTSFLLAATVVLAVPCGVFVVDETGTVIGSVTGVGQVVIRDFQTGAATVHCRATVPAPGQRVVLDYATTGRWCSAGARATTDWVETIQADGTAHLRCRIVGRDTRE